MSKRKSEEELIQLYHAKIKKLEKQQTTRRRRIIVSSDSESDSEQEEIENYGNEELADTNINDEGLLATEITLSPDESLPNSLLPTNNPSSVEAATDVPVESAAELDPEMRLALGDPAEEIPTYGENIHADLAKRWLPILRKGLTKDVKEKLLKEHNVPDNCKLLKAPRLNPEIAAAVTEIVRSRDKKLEAKQDQLGLGITAISRAVSALLEDKKKVEVIKLLSEGCRILSDLHFTETETRSKLITPCLDKSFLHIIKDEERDDTLFGTKLSEKIKSAKVIEKQGLQIKRNAPSAGTKSTVQQQTPARRQAGNWTAPPRYSTSSANRGGRGAYTASRNASGTPYKRIQTRTSPARSSSTTTAPQTRQATYRQRAQTRQ